MFWQSACIRFQKSFRAHDSACKCLSEKKPGVRCKLTRLPKFEVLNYMQTYMKVVRACTNSCKLF